MSEGRPQPAPQSLAETQTQPSHVQPGGVDAGSGGSSSRGSGLVDHGRFPPGQILAGRYRIVELLGRGGMGEVYRADDLTLEQTVALKFIPQAEAASPAALAAMHSEVRIARQISHPNVCRVYDVGEAEGHPFITMEYIDGENLATLLKRIGRISPDKAADISRQLCAALAAAHDVGILHRDLKPSNVMIDGRGQVRITDFGLAGMAEQFRQEQVRAGTPAYMAPEQLAGREVTVRSDIYALGLILYEIYTGKRTFEARTVAEISRLHSQSTPTLPSSLVPDLDDAVERVILRCLGRDPKARPTSARAVAAALPGGDPLAAALAAGETPSPELIAAAGPAGGLSRAQAGMLLAAILGGLALVIWLVRPGDLLRYVPVKRPPAVLADRAREMLERLGYSSEPADSKGGFIVDLEPFAATLESPPGSAEWLALADDQPSPVSYWYRESASHMVATGLFGSVSADDPPLASPGMVLVQLTPDAKLRALRVVPGRAAASGPSVEPDWSMLFQFAGLQLADFETADPVLNPRDAAELHRTWSGTWPDHPDRRITVEAASVGGRPTWFAIVRDRPGQSAADEPPTSRRGRIFGAVINMAAIAICILGAGYLARRNVVLKRGDRAGALRVAWTIALISLASSTILVDHVPDGPGEMSLFVRALGLAMVRAGIAWVLYLALEPTIRRVMPDTLVSWSRLLAGRFHDPVVARDVLIGAALAMISASVYYGHYLLAATFGWAPGEPSGLDLNLLDPMLLLSRALVILIAAVSTTMFAMLLLTLLLIAVRRRAIAMSIFLALAAAVVIGISYQIAPAQPWPAVAIGLVGLAVFAVAVFRFGLVCVMATMYVQTILTQFPPRFDLSAWYVVGGLLPLAIVAALALAAYGVAIRAAGPSWLREPAG